MTASTSRTTAIRLIEANLVAWIVDYRGSTGEIEYRFNFEKRTGIFKGAHGFGLLYNCSQKQ
jgi:hypothetical protein